MPTARQIAVVDREKQAVIATWPVETAEANSPMALQEAHVLIGCRKPGRLLAIDIETGKTVAVARPVLVTPTSFFGTPRGSKSMFREARARSAFSITPEPTIIACWTRSPPPPEPAPACLFRPPTRSISPSHTVIPSRRRYGCTSLVSRRALQSWSTVWLRCVNQLAVIRRLNGWARRHYARHVFPEASEPTSDRPGGF